MLIGIPREIKDHEFRVALPPDAVAQLTAAGHPVRVARGAGAGSGFDDDAYRAAGADVCAQEEAFGADLVLKVKEPQPTEIPLFGPEQTLFTFLHLAADRELTQNLLATGVTAIAYEAVQAADGRLPILAPMSQVAGALAVVVGANLLQRRHGGRGVLLPAIDGVPAGRVTVLGAGVVGTHATRVACGMGARVTVLDRSGAALTRIAHDFPAARTLPSTPESLATCLMETDLLVGAVLIPGAHAPSLVTRAMVRAMPKGSVIVDVAIDQGGCVEGIRATSHSDPAYAADGVIHCAIPNLPGVVPRTSTLALAAATMPYIKTLAGHGWRAAARLDPALKAGIRMTGGKLSHQGIADAFRLPYNAAF
ncbi:MAG: alanine dehydrogenase [Nitrospirae bacterium]|nr:alanine dehydrogenase [Nitrospirota bacterium]